jgi:hypothetical protein
MGRGYPKCACRKFCADVPENDDNPRAVCKALKPIPLSRRCVKCNGVTQSSADPLCPACTAAALPSKDRA